MRIKFPKKQSLIIDRRLLNLCEKDKELKVTEEEFHQAIKAYKLDEALEQLARQWYLFYKINKRIGGKTFEDLDPILQNETGLSILEYTKLSFVIYATIITNPRFNIGGLSGVTMKGLTEVLNDVNKMTAFLNLISSNYEEFRTLDKEINKALDPIYTKTRFNPLWLKPVIRMGENDFLVPSTTAYMTSTFKGLFWWFDTYFRKLSRVKGDEFRSYFGTLFEEYAGEVLKDIYTERKVSPQIVYGAKKDKGLFFDWIVSTPDKIFLFEVKAYQFPLEVLQKGDAESIRKEVVNKIIYTIIQMYKRVNDINKFPELIHLKGKNIIPIGVFYEIPFVSTPMYEENILPALTDLESKYPGIKNFRYYLIGIAELENYYYVADQIDIDTILHKVTKSNEEGFVGEISNLLKEKPTSRKNLLDRAFNEYCSDIIGITEEDNT